MSSYNPLRAVQRSWYFLGCDMTSAAAVTQLDLFWMYGMDRIPRATFFVIVVIRGPPSTDLIPVERILRIVFSNSSGVDPFPA